MTDSPRILLVAGDTDGGCGHYRMREPARVARLAGIDVEVVTSLPMEATVTGDRLKIEKLEVEADLVVFQRPTLRAFGQVMVELQRRGIACAIEIDDDIAAVHKGNAAYADFHPRTSPSSNWEHLINNCAIADLVICSTPSLARRYAGHGRSVVVRNRIAAADINRDKEYGLPLRLGWAGSMQSHPEDLQVSGPHIRSAMQAAGLDELKVVGDGHGVGGALSLTEGMGVGATGWVPREQYLGMVADHIDVGIVPLKVDIFNQGKSWLKLLEYSSQGIPAIVSPTDENIRLAQVVGADVARKPRDWQVLIKRMLLDRDHSIERGAIAREKAAGFTYEGAVGEWADAWMTAIETRASMRRVITRPAASVFGF